MNMLKLKGKMVENGYSVETLASKIGVDRSTLYRRFNDGEKFTLEEVGKIKTALNLADDEATVIFLN